MSRGGRDGRLGLIAALAVALALQASVAQGAGRYRTYPTCDVIGLGKPTPGHSCHQGDYWGAVFIDKEARGYRERRYRICIRRPDQTKDCYRRRSVGRKPAVDGFSGMESSQLAGPYRFIWKKAGRVIDRARIRILPAS